MSSVGLRVGEKVALSSVGLRVGEKVADCILFGKMKFELVCAG